MIKERFYPNGVYAYDFDTNKLDSALGFSIERDDAYSLSNEKSIEPVKRYLQGGKNCFVLIKSNLESKLDVGEKTSSKEESKKPHSLSLILSTISSGVFVGGCLWAYVASH